MQNQRKFQESHKERHFTKEISSSFHVSYISEIFLKHLSTFASQPKEIFSAPPKPSCDCSWVLGEAQSGFKTGRDQRCLLFSKIFWESVLQLTERVPDIYRSPHFWICWWQCCSRWMVCFRLIFVLDSSWLCWFIYF